MIAKLIINPYAGRWKAWENVPRLEAALTQAGLAFELAITQKADEGIQLARDAAEQGFSPVIAVGGDSTCSEVINGLTVAAGEGPTTPMGIIPLGTANDLAFGQGIPLDVEAAVEVIARGNTRLIDVGRVNGRYFANNSAVGLEPVVTQENARLVRVKGTIRYLLAALICIWRRPSWRMVLEWDGGDGGRNPGGRYEGPTTLVSVGNHRRTGGVFFMTPQAEPDDGLLDFVQAPAMSRLKLFRLLPTTFNGTHVNRPEILQARTRKLLISCRPGTPIQADGEVFELNATEILYEILPQKLTVIAGRQGPAATPA